ncbi:uncharacterized protein C11orf97-like [Leucoraja erinacea]|uniref:uncharacterized protein C11orf97-like n=1 Tax=Leucoraja erinaceus TaxID=7782 RepID=UPI002454191A|nr:uncharacterized protein C11orf97-like [Leucoraja erinacea]
MARDAEDADAAAAAAAAAAAVPGRNKACRRGRSSAGTAGASKKMFLYNGPVEKSHNLPTIQSHKLQDKKQMNSIDLDQVWNVRRNIPLGQLKTAKTSSTSTKYYSRYGEVRDNTIEMKQSSRSKECQMNGKAYDCLNKQEEFDF